MSVKKAQNRIAEIKDLVANIDGIIGVGGHSASHVKIYASDEYGKTRGNIQVSGNKAGLFFDALLKMKSELLKELEPLEQLMGAADLMFKNAGGGNVAPSN